MASFQINSFLNNRHLAEWRLLLFFRIRIVMVYPSTLTVRIIGISDHLLSSVMANRLPRSLLRQRSSHLLLAGIWNVANPLSAGSACYDARNKKSGENGKAVIIRVQTFYGPHCGVFLVLGNDKVEFKGYSSLHGRVSQQLKTSYSSRRVEYWSRRIKEMLK